MAVNIEIKVLTVFILFINILMIIYYIRNIPRPADKKDNENVVIEFVEDNDKRVNFVTTKREHSEHGHLDDGKVDTIENDAVERHDSLHTTPVDVEPHKVSEQTLDDTDGDFQRVANNVFVYSVYLDDRKGRFIRFIALVGPENRTELICQFDKGIVADASFYKTCESHEKPYAAYLITCPVPNSVARTDITSGGVVIISREVPKRHTHFHVTVAASSRVKYQFTVCVPPLYGNIPQDQIIEFIETTKVLGANHFIFYNYDVDDTVRLILESYGKELLEVKSWKHKFTDKVLWYKGQSASVWDCLFHSMFSSAYIAFNDIDEFIVPRIADGWAAMTKVLDRKNSDAIAGYRFKSVTFDNKKAFVPPKFSDDIGHLRTLKTVIRTKQGDLRRSKLIVDPRKVFELGIHHLSKPLEERYITINVKMDIAMLHHYREFAGFPMKRKVGTKAKDIFIEDYTMWRYKTNITNSVNNRLTLLKKKYLHKQA